MPTADKADAKVYKFVGDEGGDGSGQVEASLDIQYIMGLAPGVKTEFWYYKNMDFCGDLKNWTSKILADEDGPLVHSVSYGFQGNMTTSGPMLGCKPGELEDVDNAFAKVAAKGISIIFASGDSGSGYSPPQPQCMGPGSDAHPSIAVNGTVERIIKTPEEAQCCEESGMPGIKAYSYYEPKPPAPGNGTYADCDTEENPAELKNEVFSGKVAEVYHVSPSAAMTRECCSMAQNVPNSVGWSIIPPKVRRGTL